MGTTAASARTRDRGAAGTCRPTSSFRDLRTLGCVSAGTRPRGQPQNANEPGRVLLVIIVAHGERGQVGVIQRVFRLPAADGDVAFVEAEAYGSGNLLLRVVDECVERLTQSCEPKAVVHELRIFERDLLFVVHQITVKAECFQFAMRG